MYQIFTENLSTESTHIDIEMYFSPNKQIFTTMDLSKWSGNTKKGDLVTFTQNLFGSQR